MWRWIKQRLYSPSFGQAIISTVFLVEQEHSWTPPRSLMGFPWAMGPPLMCMSSSSRTIYGSGAQDLLQKHAVSQERCLWAEGWVERVGLGALQAREAHQVRQIWSLSLLSGCCTVWPGSLHWKEPGRSSRSCCWAVKWRGPVQGFKRASFWGFLQPGFAAPRAGGQHNLISKAPTPSHAFVREVTSAQLCTWFCCAEAPIPSARLGLSWQLHRVISWKAAAACALWSEKEWCSRVETLSPLMQAQRKH